MGWQLAQSVHGSINSQRELVNLDVLKLFLQPNVPQAPLLEMPATLHCGWLLLNISFVPSHKVKMAIVLVGSCSQAFLVLWWHTRVCLGMVTTLGHTHLGLLLHLSKCLREFHELNQARLAVQWVCCQDWIG